MKSFVIDFETSGFNQFHSDIIEIGASILDTGETFSSLIRPKSEKLIPENIREITGITHREMRRVCREKRWVTGDWYKGCEEFYQWIVTALDGDTECAIIAHNGVGFDFPLLKQMLYNLRLLGVDTSAFERVKIHYVDTLLISRRLLCNVFSHKQGDLCRLFQIDVDVAHRALADVEALSQLYRALVHQMERNGYSVTPPELIRYTNLEI
jgi:DNA polymerase-3 subunit alpha (Gram-positive type)